MHFLQNMSILVAGYVLEVRWFWTEMYTNDQRSQNVTNICSLTNKPGERDLFVVLLTTLPVTARLWNEARPKILTDMYNLSQNRKAMRTTSLIFANSKIYKLLWDFEMYSFSGEKCRTKQRLFRRRMFLHPKAPEEIAECQEQTCKKLQ